MRFSMYLGSVMSGNFAENTPLSSSPNRRKEALFYGFVSRFYALDVLMSSLLHCDLRHKALLLASD